MAPVLRHRNLPHLLLRAREALMAHFRPLLTEAGLTEQQWRILRALHEQGSLESRHLSEACSISSPSIVGVLLRLEETGLLQRERMAHDQRRLMVSLTATGRRLARGLIPRIERRYEELEAAVGIAAMREVYDAIDALLARVPVVAQAGPIEHGTTARAPPSAVRSRPPASASSGRRAGTAR